MHKTGEDTRESCLTLIPTASENEALPMFSEDLVTTTLPGDLQALCELDARGVFCGDDEDAQTLAERIRHYRKISANSI